MTELDRHRAAIDRLRRAPAHRRDPAWSLALVEHLLAVQTITGNWESY